VLYIEQLNIDIILTLISVNQIQTTPLYINHVIKILRKIISESFKFFNYLIFKRRLDEADLNKK
jgi:hypothetical protein